MEYLVLCTLWRWIFVGVSGVVANQKSGTFAGFQTDKTITGYDLYSVPVTSKLECVVRCLEDERCSAAVTYCEELDMLKVSSCILKSVTSSPLLNSATKSESGKCFVALYSLSNGNLGSSSSTSPTVGTTNFETTEQTTAEEITTTTETTTSSTNSSNILGMVGNLEHMCFVGSGKDIALFTKDGIYIYNSKDDLNSSPCLFTYPADFDSLFPGYENDRPPLNDIDCAVGYQNYIEIYAENKMWKWTVNSGATVAQGSPTTFSSKLGGTILPSNPQWCTYRQKIGRDYYFYENSTFIFKSNQSPFERIFTQEEDFLSSNLLHLNPWKKLPADTVAVCSVNDQYTMYIVVTSDMSFYEYEINYSTGNNNPTVSITLKGSIKF